MFTTHGEMLEAQLQKVVSRESIPCGTCVKTTYTFEGEVVRRDINIEVDPEKVPALDGATGIV